MQDTREKLLDGVKATVARYGLAEFTTRRLAEVSGINNGLIYHYFKGKEDILLSAYCRENGEIFSAIFKFLDEVHSIPFPYEVKVRLFFHKIWRELLSDSERLVFCWMYYHSGYFKSAGDFHKEQVKLLQNRLGGYFKTESGCVQAMYSMLSILYDSSQRTIDGVLPKTDETEEQIYGMFLAVLKSQVREEMFSK